MIWRHCLLCVAKSEICIKQFAVTNSSKERPVSIVTETLKNGISIPIDHTIDTIDTNRYHRYQSKESYFMLISNIQISSSLILHIKSYQPEKLCLILENRGKYPLKEPDLHQKTSNTLKEPDFCADRILTKNHIIRFNVSENPIVEVLSSYLQKCGI